MNQVRHDLLRAPSQARAARTVARGLVAVIGSVVVLGSIWLGWAAVRGLQRFESARAADDERGTIARLWDAATTHGTPPSVDLDRHSLGQQAAAVRCTLMHTISAGASDKAAAIERKADRIAEHCRNLHLDGGHAAADPARRGARE